MARQKTDIEKLKALHVYYLQIKCLFDQGRLTGKIETMMEGKCFEFGFTLRTFYRYKNRMEDK